MPRFLLPKDLYSRLPYCIRRRLNQRQTFVLVVLVATAGAALVVLQIGLLVMLLKQQGDGSSSLDGRVGEGLVVGDTARQPSQGGNGGGAGGRKGPEDGPDRLGGGKFLSGKVIGVRQEDLHQFMPARDKSFLCFPSGKTIPFKYVNDDYCDCPEDGSDEPSTGACEKSNFFCPSQDADASTPLPTSRINDGLCDCCDGSDEWADRISPAFRHLAKEDQDRLGRFQVPCPVKC